MINPESRFRLAWDAFIMLLTVIVSIQAPLMIVFDIQPVGLLYYLDLFVTGSFSIDIVLNFCTARVEKNHTRTVPAKLPKNI
jgi:hypothetical protein